MNQKNIIKRIISSPILQAILIYVSGAWIALEITDYIITNYGLSDKVRDVLSIVLLFGLPVAVFLTWYTGKVKQEIAPQDQRETTERAGDDHPGKEISKVTLKKSRLYATAGIILLAVAITIIFRERHKTKIAWARDVLLPEIERIAGERSWEGHENPIAFNLIDQAKRFIPDDPLLLRLEDQIVGQVSIYTDPEGALVYYKPYSDIDSEWELLGKAPVNGRKLPMGLSRIRMEKEGYQSLQDLLRTSSETSRWYKLSDSGSLPEGMELISDTIWPLLVTRIVGLGHLEYKSTGDFLMDRYEVTNEAYKKFMDEGGYQDPDYWQYPFIYEGDTISRDDAMVLFVDKTGRPGPSTWEIGDYPDGQDLYPVSGVSWYEAAAYAAYAGKDLPTLYHYNKVAYTPGGSVIIPLANFSDQGAIPVGASQSMNRFGVFDLAGNVREWYFNINERDDQRFILGGGWNDQIYAFNFPYSQDPFNRSEANGFRCMKYLVDSGVKEELEKPVDMPFRDFLNEPIVSDEIFAVYLNQYRYDKKDLNAQIEETIEEGDYIRQRITFDAAYGGERMMAYLFLPKSGTPPFQTVIFFPGSGAITRESSQQLVRDEMFMLTKSGRAVIYPIYKSTYERGDELETPAAAATNYFREHVIMWVKDLSRSIDYLESRSEIDTSKLAYFGYSWGGFMGAYNAAVEKRFKTSVLVLAGLIYQRTLPEVEMFNYLPRIKIPVLMLNGRYDPLFPYETSQLPFFELLGTPDEDKRIIVYEKAHNVPGTQLTKETLAWLDKYLGPVNE